MVIGINEPEGDADDADARFNDVLFYVGDGEITWWTFAIGNQDDGSTLLFILVFCKHLSNTKVTVQEFDTYGR